MNKLKKKFKMKSLMLIKTKKTNKKQVKLLEAFGLKTKRPIIKEFPGGKFSFQVRIFKNGLKRLSKLVN